MAYVKIGHLRKDGMDQADVDEVVTNDKFSKADKR